MQNALLLHQSQCSRRLCFYFQPPMGIYSCNLHFHLANQFVMIKHSGSVLERTYIFASARSFQPVGHLCKDGRMSKNDNSGVNHHSHHTQPIGPQPFSVAFFHASNLDGALPVRKSRAGIRGSRFCIRQSAHWPRQPISFLTYYSVGLERSSPY